MSLAPGDHLNVRVDGLLCDTYIADDGRQFFPEDPSVLFCGQPVARSLRDGEFPWTLLEEELRTGEVTVTAAKALYRAMGWSLDGYMETWEEVTVLDNPLEPGVYDGATGGYVIEPEETA